MLHELLLQINVTNENSQTDDNTQTVLHWSSCHPHSIQTDRHTDRLTDKHIDTQTHRQTDRLTDRLTDRRQHVDSSPLEQLPSTFYTDRQTDRQTDIQTHRQTHRQTYRQTHRHTDSDRMTRVRVRVRVCVYGLSVTRTSFTRTSAAFAVTCTST